MDEYISGLVLYFHYFLRCIMYLTEIFNLLDSCCFWMFERTLVFWPRLPTLTQFNEIFISKFYYFLNRINDIITSVNNISTVDVMHADSVEALKRAGNTVCLVRKSDRIFDSKLQLRGLYLKKKNVFGICSQCITITTLLIIFLGTWYWGNLIGCCLIVWFLFLGCQEKKAKQGQHPPAWIGQA